MHRHAKQVSFRLPDDMQEALTVIKDRDGIPFSEQLRRALKKWIEDKDIAPLAVRKGKR
jgi:predicted DNA-binding protein